jgi:hypothetical protein
MSGEPLGRLPGRFWATTSPEADLAGEEGASPSDSDDHQGSSPFFPSSISPSPNRSLSSSAESQCLKRWRKKAVHRALAQECDTILHSRSWDAASPAPYQTSPAPSTSLGSWSGVKVPVLAPTTFMEHAIVASEWTRVQPRRRRSSAPLLPPTTASRGKLFKPNASLMWIKKQSARPSPGSPGLDQPSAPGFSTATSRRSGLYRILGFH